MGMWIKKEINISMTKIKFFLFLFFIFLKAVLSFAQLNPCKQGNLWGYCDSMGKMIIKPTYDGAGVFINGFARIKISNAWGLINFQNKKVISVEFDKINITDSFIIVEKNSKTGIYDTTGKLLISPIFNDIEVSYKYFIVKEQNGKKGLYSLNGKEILSPTYDKLSVDDYHPEGTNEIILLTELNGVKEYWFTDTATGKLLNPSYQKLKAINKNGFFKGARLKDNINTEKGKVKFALIKNRVELTQFIYDDIRYRNPDLIAVESDEYYGLLDTNGKEILPLKYDKIGFESNGLMAVKMMNKYFFINRKGERIIPKKFDAANDFENGVAVVGKTVFKDNKPKLLYGIIDTSGKEIIPLIYLEIHPAFKKNKSNPNLFIAKQDSTFRWGMIDSKNKEILPFKFKQFEKFDGNNRAITTIDTIIDNKKMQYWGIIDITGKTIVQFKYNNSIERFKNGRAKVKNHISQMDYIGIIDSTGYEIVPPKYQDIKEFKNGYAVVRIGQHKYLYGVIDSTGKEIIPPIYRYIDSFNEGIALMSKGTDSSATVVKYGYINNKGIVIVEPKFDEAVAMKNGIACVIINKMCGVIDKSGNIIVPIVYSGCRIIPIKGFQGFIQVSNDLEQSFLFTNYGKEIVKACKKLENGNGCFYYETENEKGKIDYNGKKIP